MTNIAQGTGSSATFNAGSTPGQVVATVSTVNVLPDGSTNVATTVKTSAGRVLSSVHADGVDVSPNDGSVITASIDSGTGVITIDGVALGSATITPKIGALSGTPFAVACSNSMGGPNEPAGNTMIAFFDPSSPDGFTQSGWTNNGTDNLTLIDAAWSPSGKALRFTMPAAFRLPLTNVQPGTGANAGKTVITATGVGTACTNNYWANGVLTGSRPVLLGNCTGAFADLNLAHLGPEGVPPTVIDADTIVTDYDISSHAAYDPSYGGYVGLWGGVTSGTIFPPTGLFSTLFNTNLYVSGIIRLHESYQGNNGAGQKLVFGNCALGASSSDTPYGASWPGISDDNTVDDGSGRCWVSADSTANGGNGANFIISESFPSLTDSELIRGTPKLFENLMIGDQEGISNAEWHLWFDATEAGTPTVSRTGFYFTTSDGLHSNYGPRGFTIFSLDNTYGGGGAMPDRDNIIDIGYLWVSGGYARDGEQPDHWHLTVDNSTPSVGDTVVVTGQLVDANGDDIHGVPGPGTGDFDDANPNADIQFSVDNSATYTGHSGVWGNPDTAGQIAINVHVVSAGVTTIQFRDIARALNGQRFGSWRTGSITVTAS